MDWAEWTPGTDILCEVEPEHSSWIYNQSGAIVSVWDCPWGLIYMCPWCLQCPWNVVMLSLDTQGTRGLENRGERSNYWMWICFFFLGPYSYLVSFFFFHEPFFSTCPFPISIVSHWTEPHGYWNIALFRADKRRETVSLGIDTIIFISCRRGEIAEFLS